MKVENEERGGGDMCVCVAVCWVERKKKEVI